MPDFHRLKTNDLASHGEGGVVSGETQPWGSADTVAGEDLAIDDGDKVDARGRL